MDAASAAERMMTMMTSPFCVGRSYVLHIPPGWVYLGTVAEVGDGWLRLTDAVYLEQATGGYTSAITAQDAAALVACCTAYAAVGEMIVQAAFISHAAPMRTPPRPLAAKAEREALSAKGGRQ